MSKEERIQEIRERVAAEKPTGFMVFWGHAKADIEFLLSELEPQTVAETIDYRAELADFWVKFHDDDLFDEAAWLKSFVQRIHSSAPDTKGLLEEMTEEITANTGPTGGWLCSPKKLVDFVNSYREKRK